MQWTPIFFVVIFSRFLFILATKMQEKFATVYFFVPPQPKSREMRLVRNIHLFWWSNEAITKFFFYLERIKKLFQSFINFPHLITFQLFLFSVSQPQKSCEFFMWLFPPSTHIIWTFFLEIFLSFCTSFWCYMLWMCTIFSCCKFLFS